jgi:GTP-binding protein Era
MSATEPGHRCGFVALVGRSNVGKSTLLNRLVGEKVAIVSALPQTTRQRILGVKTTERGQLAFIDSPGFHKPHDRLGEMMLERAQGVAEEADVILLMVDASAGIGPGDTFVKDQLDPPSRRVPVVLAPNKIDLINKAKTLPMIDVAVNEWGCREAVPISAKDGLNCDRLVDTLLAHLPEGPALFPPDYRTDQQERGLVAEIVREKLLGELRQEVPYAVAVTTDHLERREDDLVEIHATIYVERESQKGIVIGSGGRMLKKVGAQAREELEQRFGVQVFLELWVKVRERWRDRSSVWRDLGLWPGQG